MLIPVFSVNPAMGDESTTDAMQTAVDTADQFKAKSPRVLHPPKPNCKSAEPSLQQCAALQPAETFCPKDIQSADALQIQSRILKASTLLKDQDSIALTCATRNTKPLRALSLTEEERQHAAIKRVFIPHLMRSQKHSLDILKKLGELQRYAPDSEPGIALVIAERESGQVGFHAGSELIDTFKSGGMDFLGEYLGRMGKSIPPAYRAKWKSADHKRTSMSGHSGKPGLIPRNELVLAYGSFIHWRYSNFKRAALKLGAKQEALDSLSPFARKAWQALFFASDAGMPCVPNKSGKCELPKSGFGGMTALTYLVKNGHSLEAVLTNPEIARFARARMAVEAARRATAVENLLGMKCSP